MKILQIFNQYRSLFNGEERVVEMIDALLKRHGHAAELWTQSSRGLETSLWGKVQATFSAVYSRSARQAMEARLDADRPDVIHAHNLYPHFSPSVLMAARKRGVPTVMTVHNHINTCPRSDHLLAGKICQRCVGGREYHCVLNNCRGNLLESVAYAGRNAAVRRLRLLADNVTTVVALNDFMGQRLLTAGFKPEQIAVLPNMVDLCDEPAEAALGQYVAFSGRISTEKGIDTLLAAAKQAMDVPVRLAGGGPLFETYQATATPNVTMLGQLQTAEMAGFYRGARFLVLPTACFEGCPLVISEAMSHGLPVIASRIGGLPELVEDGVTGFLFEQGNVAELAEKMQRLWNNPALCTQMGLAGRAKAEREFGADAYHRRLVEIYQDAIQRVSHSDQRRTAVYKSQAVPQLVGGGLGNESSFSNFN